MIKAKRYKKMKKNKSRRKFWERNEKKTNKENNDAKNMIYIKKKRQTRRKN